MSYYWDGEIDYEIITTDDPPLDMENTAVDGGDHSRSPRLEYSPITVRERLHRWWSWPPQRFTCAPAGQVRVGGLSV